VEYALLRVLKSVINVVLNASNILSERINETKRVLKFDSVLAQTLINIYIKTRVLNDYYFINKKIFFW
jgi:hypothetical protein